jgi:RNA polymerase sigma-70 factor (ECF subfamily)
MATSPPGCRSGRLDRVPESQHRHAQYEEPAQAASGASPAPGAGARTDRTLIGALARGDVDALASLYDRYVGELFAIALRILGDAADAEEVVADTFTRAWQSADRYDAARGSVAGWLVTMVRSRAIDRLRSRRARETASRMAQPQEQHASPAASADPERDTSRAEYRVHVRRALNELSEDQRAAVDLALYAGFSHSEIADRLGVPLGTIKTRIRSAMQKLKSTLGPLYRDEFA